MENLKQTIKCDVSNCKYNNDTKYLCTLEKNDTKYLCTLEKIDISCTCNKEKCHSNAETICKSFKEKK